jgi:antitoxin ParD1/3/4
MRSTEQFSITLSHELADMVRSKVSSGEYATDSEVIRAGLRALQQHERALENWIREEVAATYDAMKADPSQAIPLDKVLARLADAHKKSKRAG